MNKVLCYQIRTLVLLCCLSSLALADIYSDEISIAEEVGLHAQKIVIRKSPEPEFSHFMNFQLCSIDKEIVHPDSHCDDESKKEKALGGIPDEDAFDSYWDIDSLIKGGVLRLDNRKRFRYGLLYWTTGILIGEYAVYKFLKSATGIKFTKYMSTKSPWLRNPLTFVTHIGVDIAATIALEESIAAGYHRYTTKAKRDWPWEQYLFPKDQVTHYHGKALVEHKHMYFPPHMYSWVKKALKPQIFLDEKDHYIKEYCDPETIEQKQNASKLTSGCVTIGEMALLIEVLLQEFTKFRRHHGLSFSGAPPPPIELYDADAENPWELIAIKNGKKYYRFRRLEDQTVDLYDLKTRLKRPKNTQALTHYGPKSQ